jgi:hypothetical protein
MASGRHWWRESLGDPVGDLIGFNLPSDDSSRAILFWTLAELRAWAAVAARMDSPGCRRCAIDWVFGFVEVTRVVLSGCFVCIGRWWFGIVCVE